MNLVDEMKQRESVHLPRGGCGPADIYTPDRSLFTQEYRATGEGFEVAEVSDFNSWDVGDGIKSFHLQAIVSIKEGGVNEFDLAVFSLLDSTTPLIIH
jgi:hypothetical protein